MSGYVPNVSPELLAGFLDEAPEYLEILDRGLMAFEQDLDAGGFSLDQPEQQNRMNEMFRAAHSFKGLGAALGFEKIRDLTHLMETLFDQVRMRKRTLDSNSVQTLFTVFDKLKALIHELSEAGPEPVTIEDSLADLEKILSSSAAPAAAVTPGDDVIADECVPVAEAGSAESEPVPDETELPSGTAAPIAEATLLADDAPDTTVAFDGGVLENAELTNLFVVTTLETLDELSGALLKLEEAPHDMELINSVFRCAHNIKGATGAAGCHALYTLTHSMETVLDLVRSGKCELDDSLMQAIFAVADIVRNDVQLIQDGRHDELTNHSASAYFGKWITTGAPRTPAVGAAKPQAKAPAQAESAVTPTAGGDLKVVVHFPKDFAEAEIQAYLIHNKLCELGDVLSTSPDVEKLDGASALERIEYLMRADAAPDDLKRIVSAYPIDRVEVLSAGEGAPPAESKPAPAPAATTAAAAAVPVGKPAPANTSAVKPPPATGPAPAARSMETAATGARPAARVGETIRVDLERLDQLMNLGGELVISKARLAQIHGRFDPLFQGQSVEYVVDDMSERLERLSAAVEGLSSGRAHQKQLADLNNDMRQLRDEFGSVRGLIDRVQAGRSAMNDFSEALHALTRISEGMQKRIMETRMVSVGPLFQRFRRVVRDISKQTGKNVELVLNGEATELDKRMIDELGDPLTHMIRNSVDHGIESPEERARNGKPPVAQVSLNAYHRGRHICIEVKDDGKGVNIEAVRRKILERGMASQVDVDRMSEKELIQYIFKPGFSTAEQVTDLSGRGMGMDIVVNKLESINGTVEVDSVTGHGATVTIKLPLTLAIITALNARIGEFVYAIPLEAVAEIITVPRSGLQSIQMRKVVRVRERVIPVALFEEIYIVGSPRLRTKSRNDNSLTLVIVESQGESLGLVVDELIGQEDVVIKNIAENYRNVQGIVGASIMGDGMVSLIIDPASMVGMFSSRSNGRRQDWETGGQPPAIASAPAKSLEAMNPCREEAADAVAG